MESPQPILTAPVERYRALYWYGQPVHSTYPRLASFVEIHLGEAYARLLTKVKFDGPASSPTHISWLADQPVKAAKKLSSFPKSESFAHKQALDNLILPVVEYASRLMERDNSEDNQWGQLLKKAFTVPDMDHVYVLNGSFLLVGWGFELVESHQPPLYGTRSGQDDSPRFRPPSERPPMLEPDLNNLFADVSNQDSPDPVSQERIPFTPPVRQPENQSLVSGEHSMPESPQTPVTPDSESYSNDSTTPAPEQPEAKPEVISLWPAWWKWGLAGLGLLAGVFLIVFLLNRPDPVQYLPDAPGVLLPIEEKDIVLNSDSIVNVAGNRLNIGLNNLDTNPLEFAKAFKAAFPDPAFKIVYYDTTLMHFQITVPPGQRDSLKELLPARLAAYSMSVWEEAMYQSNALPSDPGFSNRDYSWYFPYIKAEGAWNVTFGSSNVVVAIVDDGLDQAHPEFAGKVVKPWNAASPGSRVYASATLTHGTHVSGTAIGNRNNGSGIAGIAPDCKIMPVQVANGWGGMSTTAIYNAVLYAIRNGADVINLSLGMHFPPSLARYPEYAQQELISRAFKGEEAMWNRIYQLADANKVTIVLAGGNDDVLVGIDPMQRNSRTIKVSAIDPSRRKADFSNYGPYSTVSAPGVHIYSAKPGGGFHFMDGTSMAAPIVTGAVALLKSVNPNLTNAEIIRILQQTGTPVSPTGGRRVGNLIQLDQALAAAGGGKLPTPPGSTPCDDVQDKIDALQRQIDQLRSQCGVAASPDTLRLPPGASVADLSGRWRSTTQIHNNFGQPVTLYFDFDSSGEGVLTFSESRLSCAANLDLVLSGGGLKVDQLADAQCNNRTQAYAAYTFTCKADANGYAQCKAQNKTYRANRFDFQLVKMN